MNGEGNNIKFACGNCPKIRPDCHTKNGNNSTHLKEKNNTTQDFWTSTSRLYQETNVVESADTSAAFCVVQFRHSH